MRTELVESKLAAHAPRLEGLRVLVLGLGRSGRSAAKLLSAGGARILAADHGAGPAVEEGAAFVRALGGETRLGGHPPELAREADLVVLSPGIPPSVPVVAEARRLGVPVWSEVELAFRFCRGRVVAVTGSNGKSTTTSMIGAVLRGAGIAGGTGGNLGTPFADLLAEDSGAAVHAVEVSSFQLETIETFRAAVAIVVNLSPDHLDRYPSFDAYVAAKSRLLETQRGEDATVLNLDDPESARLSGSVRGRLFRFSTRKEVEAGAFVRGGRLVVRTADGDAEILDASELPVPGEHNLANAAAAALACRLSGCSSDDIARGLRTFRALPHRLEFVATLGGVSFYNDSKATNLDAAARALRSFPPGRVHVILGGKDKGADWPSLAALVRERARRVLLVGEAAPLVRSGLQRTVPLVDCETVPAAVRVGFEGAEPGDVVVLAPGCASFDQYRNFEERGRDFRRAVEELSPGRDRDA